MIRTLKARILLAFVLILVLLSTSIVVVLNYAMRESLNRGIDQMLSEIVDAMISGETTYEDLRVEIFDEDEAADMGGTRRMYFLLESPDGQTVSRLGHPGSALTWPADRVVEALRPGERRRDVLSLSGVGELRVVSVGLVGGGVFRVGIVPGDISDFRGNVLKVGLMISLAVSAIGGLVAWFIIGAATRGIDDVGRTARGIIDGRLDSRVPIHPGQVREVTALAAVFNRMLDQISSLLHSMRDVTVNIAHDMRTPVTRIRNSAEMVLRSDIDVNAAREFAVKCISEAESLESLTSTMLEIARLDSGLSVRANVEVDLAEAARDICDLYTDAAGDRRLQLDCEISEDRLTVNGDRVMLQRVLSNVIDNAVKFTPEGGRILVTLRRRDDHIRLSVSDTGPGLAPADHERVFGRFVRGDLARSMPGHGLGLSYVRSAVNAHAGRVWIESEPGKGFELVIELPIRPN